MFSKIIKKLFCSQDGMEWVNKVSYNCIEINAIRIVN